jgi:hypothetical protein
MAVHTGSANVVWVPPATLPTTTEALRFLADGQVGSAPRSALALAVVALDGASWLVAALALADRWRHRRRSVETWSLAVLLLWLVVPTAGILVLAGLGEPLLVERYFMIAVPAGAILTGYAASLVPRPPPAAALLAAAVAARAVVIFPTYAAPLEDWRQAAQTFLTEANRGDCLAFFEADGYLSFRYYLPGSGPSSPWPVVLPTDPAAVHSDYLLSLSSAQVDQVSVRCPVLWLVTTHVAGPLTTPYYRRRSATYQALVTALTTHYRVTARAGFLAVSLERLAH